MSIRGCSTPTVVNADHARRQSIVDDAVQNNALEGANVDDIRIADVAHGMSTGRSLLSTLLPVHRAVPASSGSSPVIEESPRATAAHPPRSQSFRC